MSRVTMDAWVEAAANASAEAAMNVRMAGWVPPPACPSGGPRQTRPAPGAPLGREPARDVVLQVLRLGAARGRHPARDVADRDQALEDAVLDHGYVPAPP